MEFVLAVGAFLAAMLGAISGLGGGIYVMPLLIHFYGEEYSHSSLTTVSLVVVLVNSLSSLFWGRQIHYVDMKFAKPIAIISAVGSLLGLWLQRQVSRDSFELYLATLLALLGIYLFIKASAADRQASDKPVSFESRDGALSFMIGAMASFFGIGGGLLQVPYLVYFRDRPVKQATATSQVMLGAVAFTALTVSLVGLGVKVPWMAIAFMAPSAVLGGVTGSRLSTRLKGAWIIRILSILLLFLAYRVSMRVL